MTFSFLFSAFQRKDSLSRHQQTIHATKKDWVCDCCGSRFGFKSELMKHMMTHLPPLFACSKCDKKFVYASNLKLHLMRHAGILNKVCKYCNKGYSTKASLSSHIRSQHFSKLHCEIPNCLDKTGVKNSYKKHLKTVHKSYDKNIIEKLLNDLEKLKPDFKKMKYV